LRPAATTASAATPAATRKKTGYVVGGVSNGKTSITVSADWSTSTPIYAWQRPYSAVSYGTPTFAGSVTIGSNYYYLDPSITTPTVAPGGTSIASLLAAGTYSGPRTQGQQFTLFNLARYVTQQIAFDRESFTMDFEHEINDYIKAGGDFLYTQTSTQSQINGQPINTSQTMLDLGVGVTASGAPGGSRVPAGQYGNPFNVGAQGRNRLVTHPRQYMDDSSSIRGVFYLRGKIGETGWSWEAGADYNRSTDQYKNPGVINQAYLDNAVANGDMNFFSRAPITDANLAADGFVGTATGGFVSLLQVYDLRVNGKVFDLPAGPVEMAVGGDIRHEGLSGVADPLSQLNPVTGALGWNGATTLYPFAASRTVKSEFAEVRIPVAKDTPGAHLLELSGAVRHEAYSGNTGKVTVPKFTLRYLPFNDEFAIRANYSKSFAAPALFNLYGPISAGFTSPFTLNKYGGGTVSNLQTQSENGANPDLKPTNSKSYSFGVVYSPKELKGFSVSLDYFNIKQSDLLGSIGSTTILQSVEDLGPASPYNNKVSFGGFNNGVHSTAPGQISGGIPDDIYVSDSLVNIAVQNVSGLNASIKYTLNVDSVGRFDINSNIGYYSNYELAGSPGETPTQYAGTSTSQQVNSGTLPRWISYTGLEYSRGKYNAYLGWRHIPGVHDLLDDSHTSDWDSFDLTGSYTFGSEIKYLSGLKVTLGVNNVFNKFAPADPASFTDAGVDIFLYGAIGRMYYINFGYKF
jgi:iron complex outermembrane receptor protein